MNHLVASLSTLVAWNKNRDYAPLYAGTLAFGVNALFPGAIAYNYGNYQYVKDTVRPLLIEGTEYVNKLSTDNVNVHSIVEHVPTSDIRIFAANVVARYPTLRKVALGTSYAARLVNELSERQKTVLNAELFRLNTDDFTISELPLGGPTYRVQISVHSHEPKRATKSFFVNVNTTAHEFNRDNILNSIHNELIKIDDVSSLTRDRWNDIAASISGATTGDGLSEYFEGEWHWNETIFFVILMLFAGKKGYNYLLKKVLHPEFLTWLASDSLEAERSAIFEFYNIETALKGRRPVFLSRNSANSVQTKLRKAYNIRGILPRFVEIPQNIDTAINRQHLDVLQGIYISQYENKDLDFKSRNKPAFPENDKEYKQQIKCAYRWGWVNRIEVEMITSITPDTAKELYPAIPSTDLDYFKTNDGEKQLEFLNSYTKKIAEYVKGVYNKEHAKI